jgi:hypothetical protein
VELEHNKSSIVTVFGMRWVRLVSCMGYTRTAHRVLGGEPENGKDFPFKTHVQKKRNNVKMDLKEIRLEGIEYVNPLTPNDLKRRRSVSPLKIKISSKNMLENPTNATIIHSVY